MYPKTFAGRGKGYFTEEEEEESVYSKKTREKLLEEESLNNEEDWFMNGYEEGFIEKIEESEEGKTWQEDLYSEEVV